MIDFLTLPTVIVLCVLACLGLQGPSRRLNSILWLGFGAHMAAAVAQVLITQHVYGIGDMLSYWRTGSQFAEYIKDRPIEGLQAALSVIAQNEAVRLPLRITGLGRSTGSMSGLAALLSLVTNGSLLSACILTSTASLAGKTLLFRAFQDSTPAERQAPLLVLILLIPSCVYWSAGILKESMVMGPIGLAVYGIHHAIKGRWVRSLVALLISVPLIAILKAYLLFPLAVAGLAWVYADRSVRSAGTLRIKPITLTLLAMIAVATVLVLGQLFPRFAFTNLEEEALRLQEVGARIDGGSNFQLQESPSSTSSGTQLLLAPLALLTTLFRPFLLEANNALALLASLEGTATFIFLALGLRKSGWRSINTHAGRSPTVIFCVTFVVITGVAIGLSTTNFGTLSRYRAPILPTLAYLIMSTYWARGTGRAPRSAHAFSASSQVSLRGRRPQRSPPATAR